MSRFEELCNKTIQIPVERQPWAVILTYSVCLSPPEECGWEGWILEGAFSSARGNTGLGFEALPCKTDQVCSYCSGELFRMENRYVFSAEQGREEVDDFELRTRSE